jgi:large subunit ribosomal protein L28
MTISRRGLAKKKGGVGRRITGRSRRRFMPNLQRMRVEIQGRVQTILVCAKCIKAGKIKRPKKRIAQTAE